ncbi:putative Lipoprotein [Candidatus Paraburkholderia schumanniana]|nr:putative Lipoprotein [Candidatus Paraburkholderia schumannianae]
MKEHGRRMRRISLRAAHAGASREIASPSGRSWLRALARGATALVVASLGACASSNEASVINLPDGQTGYAVNCSGADASSSWASCYVLAGRKCGATGYDIVSKDNEEGGPTGGGITNVISANVKNRSMIVRYK